MKTDFTVPYPRPQNYDVINGTCQRDESNEILKKEDDEITASDWSCLFFPQFAMNTYRESCYFLPIVLKYLESNHGDPASVLEYVLSWIYINRRPLENDGLMPHISKFLDDDFDNLTRRFKIGLDEDNERCVLDFDEVLIIISYYNGTLDMTEGAIERPAREVDDFLSRHWSNPQTYSEYAWLTYLSNLAPDNRELGCSFFTNFRNNKALYAEAQKCIRQEIGSFGELYDFWNEIFSCQTFKNA